MSCVPFLYYPTYRVSRTGGFSSTTKAVMVFTVVFTVVLTVVFTVVFTVVLTVMLTVIIIIHCRLLM